MTKPLPLGKTFISSWLNFYLLTKPFTFMAKPLALGKAFLFHGKNPTSWQNLSTSWLNLYLLAKPFNFITKPLPFGTSS
jgi:hypothetical protein